MRSSPSDQNTTTTIQDGDKNVTTEITVSPSTNTTNVTKTVVKKTATPESTTPAAKGDCGKFPSSGEHPAGANWPVVP